VGLADLKVGIEGRLEIVVDDSHTAHALGYEGVHVLGTPTLTLFCERCAGQSIAFAKGPGDSSVGLHNDIWHLAAARPGDTVVIESRLVAISGRKLTFELKGTVNGKPLVKGLHEQVWVELERFLKPSG
jgi:predicted thioesterase